MSFLFNDSICSANRAIDLYVRLDELLKSERETNITSATSA
jgi:hypothetical protein